MDEKTKEFWDKIASNLKTTEDYWVERWEAEQLFHEDPETLEALADQEGFPDGDAYLGFLHAMCKDD